MEDSSKRDNVIDGFSTPEHNKKVKCLYSPSSPAAWANSGPKCHGKVLFSSTPFANRLLERRPAVTLAENSPLPRRLSLRGLSRLRSFEANQSFPRTTRLPMERIRGDGPNSCSFSAGRSRGSFPDMRRFRTTPLSAAAPAGCAPVWLQHTPMLPLTSCGSAVGSGQHQQLINPNKAVFTIEMKTSQILVVNNQACQLLGYTPSELCTMRLEQLMHVDHRSHVTALAEDQIGDIDAPCAGKVVEMISKEHHIVPVSLWLRRLDAEGGRCLAVAEAVERQVGQLVIDHQGNLASGDHAATLIFHYDHSEELENVHLNALIPLARLPKDGLLTKEIQKQKATGRTKEGASFPLCMRIDPVEDNLTSQSETASLCSSTDSLDQQQLQLQLQQQQQPTPVGSSRPGSAAGPPAAYIVTVWVYANMSGLIVVDASGIVETCNHHFTHLMLGYTKAELVGQNIRKLLPNFGIDAEFIPIDEHSEYETTTEHSPAEELIPSLNRLSLSFASQNKQRGNFTMSQSAPSMITPTNQLPPATLALPGLATIKSSNLTMNDSGALMSNNENGDLTPVNDRNLEDEDIFETASEDSNGHDRTPSINYEDDFEPDDDHNDEADVIIESAFKEGTFHGKGKHKDGSELDLIYKVKLVVLASSRMVHCVWISRDPDEHRYLSSWTANLTLTSSFNSTLESSLGQAIRGCAQQTQQPPAQQPASRPASVSFCDEEELTSGPYGERYTTLQQIGKGAYGYVRMAFRNDDRLLVVTKFIRKEKVHRHCWVEDPNLQRKLPLEISLLTTLQHPNIVQVLDVFENTRFFQLVMEKHGAGMDLFEFIDRKPYLDETLNSYIFRQIVSAVEYLHSLSILHRDIKDENVIIDEHFHAKLIDFGSATFMSEGRLFATFYGTVEYCSPEVLAGNRYKGPELEVWSMGVTLYVMTFGENPFFDVEEILKAELHPPGKVSDELMRLLLSMLCKNPDERCTVADLVSHPWLNQVCDTSRYRFEQVVSCLPGEARPARYAHASLATALADDDDSTSCCSSSAAFIMLDEASSNHSLASLATVENYIAPPDCELDSLEQDSFS